MQRCLMCETLNADKLKYCFICGYDIREGILRKQREEEERLRAERERAEEESEMRLRSDNSVFTDESTDGRISYSYSAEKMMPAERIFSESALDEEIGKHDEEKGGFMKHLRGIFSKRK